MTEADPSHRSGSPKRVLITVVVVVVVAGVITAVWRATTSSPRTTSTSTSVGTSTAPVTRGTITERVQIAGALGFDGSYTVVHQGGPGVLTALPEPGTVVDRGAALYSVSSQPVRLLFGTVPVYRDLDADVTDGA